MRPHAGDRELAGDPARDGRDLIVGARVDRGDRFVRVDRLGHDDVLVNLDGELPSAFSRFQRVVEIVDTSEQDRQPARNRFKFYRERGYALSTQDLSQR